MFLLACLFVFILNLFTLRDRTLAPSEIRLLIKIDPPSPHLPAREEYSPAVCSSAYIYPSYLPPLRAPLLCLWTPHSREGFPDIWQMAELNF